VRGDESKEKVAGIGARVHDFKFSSGRDAGPSL